MEQIRVLQLLGDTDARPEHTAAVALHRALTGEGFAVRTLALGPGDHLGLEEAVPAIAPSRRSFAARGLVHQESRWADVVVLVGPRALTLATVPARSLGVGPPTIVATDRLSDRSHTRRWSPALRTARLAVRIVAPDAAAVERIGSEIGRTTGIEVVGGAADAGAAAGVDTRTWSRILREAVG